MKRRTHGLVLLASLVAGCASYQPLSLPTQDSLARDASRLQVDVDTLSVPALRTHRFDPSDGFDMTEIATLAVVNSPDLRALRADAGIARAQAFSAGLLPDPQLALTGEQAMGSPAGATVAFSAGLAVDLGAILARSSTRAAADAQARKADLDLLWQEWQTVAKARLLFVKVVALQRSQGALEAHRARLRPRLADAQSAVARGLVTSDVVAPQLAAFADVDKQWSDLERQRNQARHELDALVGVAPDVTLLLVDGDDVAAMDDTQVRDAIAVAPRRRPDLLALQAGFEAQDDRYRGALRAQFPAITVGPTRARDTSDVDTVGLSLGITLPLFNRNRGNIAIEAATRERSRLDYQQRLDATAGDAHRLLAEQEILRRQAAAIDAALPALALAAQRADDAFRQNNLDALALINVETALMAKRLEQIDVHEALQEQAIALQALLGTSFDLPASRS